MRFFSLRNSYFLLLLIISLILCKRCVFSVFKNIKVRGHSGTWACFSCLVFREIIPFPFLLTLSGLGTLDTKLLFFFRTQLLSPFQGQLLSAASAFSQCRLIGCRLVDNYFVSNAIKNIPLDSCRYQAIRYSRPQQLTA